MVLRIESTSVFINVDDGVLVPKQHNDHLNVKGKHEAYEAPRKAPAKPRVVNLVPCKIQWNPGWIPIKTHDALGNCRTRRLIKL